MSDLESVSNKSIADDGDNLRDGSKDSSSSSSSSSSVSSSDAEAGAGAVFTVSKSVDDDNDATATEMRKRSIATAARKELSKHRLKQERDSPIHFRHIHFVQLEETPMLYMKPVFLPLA
jgi:hypothetical protein